MSISAELRQFLEVEHAWATLMVDGTDDGGGHLHAAHRELNIKTRRILEDAGRRSSSQSQLLQMADLCAHAAFQSIAQNPHHDPAFWVIYEKHLDRLLHRPFGITKGRCIWGLDC